MRKILVLLETSDIGARYSGDAASRLGYDPVFMINPRNYQADTRAQLRNYRTVTCDTSRPDHVIAALGRAGIRNVAGIMTFLDSRLVPAFDLAERLNVNGPDPAVVILKDKGLVADLLGPHGPPTIRFHRSRIPFEAIREMIGEFGRVVLKPTQAAGGIGNFTITKENYEKLETFVRHPGLPQDLDRGFWVVQGYVKGSLYSLEGYVEGGALTVLGFSGRRKIGLTESQINFPADNELNSEQRVLCRMRLEHLISKAGFTRGYVHVEFIVRGRDVEMIDANVGRLGGGSVGEQLADAFGIDPVEVYRHAIQCSIFPQMAPKSPYHNAPVPTLGLLYGVHARGRFDELRLPTEMMARHTQILDTGQLIPEMGVNNWSWIGILSGRPTEVGAAIQRVRILKDGEWHSPCF